MGVSQTQGPQNALSDPELLMVVPRKGRAALQGCRLSKPRAAGPLPGLGKGRGPSSCPEVPTVQVAPGGPSVWPLHCKVTCYSTAQASGLSLSLLDCTLGSRLKWCCLAFQGLFVLWNLFPSHPWTLSLHLSYSTWRHQALLMGSEVGTGTS